MILITIFSILLIFSVIWILVWFWFFKVKLTPGKNFHKLADKAFKSGDYKTAKELFLKIENIQNNLKSQYKLGLVHLNLREYDKAQLCFENVVKASPKNIEAMENLGLSLQAQQKYDDAILLYTKLEKENPKNPEWIINIGKISYEKGDFEGALSIFQKAKDKFRNNSKILFYITKCNSELCNLEDDNERQKIIGEYNKLFNRKDMPAEFYISLAKLYAMSGNVEKAENCCQKTILMTSEDTQAYQLFGLIQLIKKDYEKAKNNLTIALNLKPSNPETHNIFSYLLCRQDNICEKNKCREKYYELVKKYLK